MDEKARLAKVIKEWPRDSTGTPLFTYKGVTGHLGAIVPERHRDDPTFLLSGDSLEVYIAWKCDMRTY